MIGTIGTVIAQKIARGRGVIGIAMMIGTVLGILPPGVIGIGTATVTVIRTGGDVMIDRVAFGVLTDEDGIYPTQFQHFRISLYYIYALDCLYTIDTLAGMSIEPRYYPCMEKFDRSITMCSISHTVNSKIVYNCFYMFPIQYHKQCKQILHKCAIDITPSFYAPSISTSFSSPLIPDPGSPSPPNPTPPSISPRTHSTK